MTSRYDKQSLRINGNEIYRKQLSNRDLSFVRQYGTPTMKDISDEELNNITMMPHVWKVGDRFFKLAHKYYQDPSKWWVIAWFNGLPTESQVEIGDAIDIPLPLNYVLELWESK